MLNRASCCNKVTYVDRGGMCERLKQAVLKTAVRETVPGVRIPLPPPSLYFQALTGVATTLATIR
jgi:hypothetical protein